MSLFAVEPWSSDATTDKLNQKLFEGVNPKLPQKRKKPTKNKGEKKMKVSVENGNDVESLSDDKKGSKRRTKLTEEEKKRKKIANKRLKQKLKKKQEKQEKIEMKQKKTRNRYKDMANKSANNQENDESSDKEEKVKMKSGKNKSINEKEMSEEEKARLAKKKEKRLKEKKRRKEKIRALKAKQVLEKANDSSDKMEKDDNNDEGTQKEGKKKRKRKPRNNKFKDLVDKSEKTKEENESTSVVAKENKKKQKKLDSNKKSNDKKKKNISVENEIEDSSNQKTKSQGKLGNTIAEKKSEKINSKKVKKNSKNISISSKMDKNSANSKPKKGTFSVDKLKEVLASQNVDTNSDDDSGEEDDDDNESDDDSSEDLAPKQEPQSLRERMQEKLNSARFRYLNQQLYSITSKDAKRLFANDKNAFNVYHQGFTSQVTKWPVNPVDNMIAYIKKRPKSLVVADFGCGDAKIARSVANTVHSFDLVSVNEHVTACDISKVPLANGSVDIAVFCLALMGTNLIDFLIEAHRVLKSGATMLIAEVASRFDKLSTFAKKLEKLGFTVKNTDTSNKMFVWLEVKKTKAKPEASAPTIELLPCVYKKR